MNFTLPFELIDWLSHMKDGEKTMSEIVTLGLEILSQVDMERLDRLVKAMGTNYGRAIDVMGDFFEKNVKSPDHVNQILADYYQSLAENNESSQERPERK